MTAKSPSTAFAGDGTPRFRAAVKRLLEIEGGFVDDPSDRGGATKYGISLRFLAIEGQIDVNGDGFADFDLDRDGDIDGTDIRRLTRAEAAALYRRCFWLRLQADSFPVPIGEMLFDQAVNAGVLAARKLLQRALNRCLLAMGERHLLKVDGVIGPVTMAALNRARAWPGVDVAEAFRDAARERYREIVRRNPSQQRFLRGWLNRADELGR